MINPAIIDPELNGKPTVLTKNISDALNNFSAFGSESLKMRLCTD